MTRPTPIMGFLDTESFSRPVHVLIPEGKVCKVTKYEKDIWTVERERWDEDKGEMVTYLKEYDPRVLECYFTNGERVYRVQVMSCWAFVIVSRFPYTDHLGIHDTHHILPNEIPTKCNL